MATNKPTHKVKSKKLTPEQRVRKRFRDRQRYWDNPHDFAAKNAAYRFKQRTRKARIEMLVAGMAFMREFPDLIKQARSQKRGTEHE